MSVDEEVRRASAAFYAALGRFLNGEPHALLNVFADGDAITTSLPIGNWARGREQVRFALEGLGGANDKGGTVEVDDLSVHVLGDVAYTLGTEHVTQIINGQTVKFSSRATNIYKRDNGQWRLVHHHVDQAQSLQSAVMT